VAVLENHIDKRALESINPPITNFGLFPTSNSILRAIFSCRIHRSKTPAKRRELDIIITFPKLSDRSMFEYLIVRYLGNQNP